MATGRSFGDNPFPTTHVPQVPELPAPATSVRLGTSTPWSLRTGTLRTPRSQQHPGNLRASSLAPRQPGVPFVTSWQGRRLLLGFDGSGTVHGKRRACPGMWLHGHVHLGGEQRLYGSQGPAGGRPRARRRPWSFIVSQNGPFIGSRWKV